MKIAGFQLKIEHVSTLEEKKKHLRRIKEKAKFHYEHKETFDLLVLPELSSITYGKDSFTNLTSLTEGDYGLSFEVFSELAQDLNCAVCYGYPYDDGTNYFIRQSVVSREGKYLANYNKMHIAQFEASPEKEYFTRGNETVVFELNDWKFGIIICYDIRFPELIRKLTLNEQVDMIIHPVAFFQDNSFPSWHPFAITRALENQVYFLSLNQAGKDYGSSIFCPPWVDFDRKPYIFNENERINVFQLDKTVMERVRKHYPLRDDMQIDFN